MQILFISNEPKPETLWGKPFPFEGWDVVVAPGPTAALLEEAAICIDTNFEEEVRRIQLYKTSGKPVLINSCLYTLAELQITSEPIIRFNHWPSFNERTKLEFAATEQSLNAFEFIFQKWQIEVERTADVPGFVSARIVAMIINEAFLALGEAVSTINEIDTAMKLGTNYPKGPFEWCELIGAGKMVSLLEKLAVTQPRYIPATLLKQKADGQ
jgi:3-hydroxybutyryl-CoA dehydrogenase